MAAAARALPRASFHGGSSGSNADAGGVEVRAPPAFALIPASSSTAASNVQYQIASGAERDEPRRRWAFAVNEALVRAPGSPWWTDVRMWADVLLFVSLIAVGARLVTLSSEDWTALGFLGPLLFGAGLTPCILSVWALFAGAALFRRENTMRALFSGAVFSIGFAMWQMAEAALPAEDYSDATILRRFAQYFATVDSLVLIRTFGPAFLEIGVLFFVEKMFFLQEDDERHIERLESELEQAKRGMGVGLAASYFYNFLLPTACNLVEDGSATPLEVEVGRGQFKPGVLKNSFLLVLVPRTLDESADIKARLRFLSTEGGVLQGRPVERERGHRPLFVYLLPSQKAEVVDAEAKADDAPSMDYCFDIPTIVSSIWFRHEDTERQRAEGSDDVLDVDVAAELLDFQNSLLDMIRQNPLTRNRVVVISTADVHNTAADIQLIAERLC